MLMCKVAAVIVTFNRKELLLQNLKECFNQNYELTKIIIVDNHGTDNTKDYLEDRLNINDLSKIEYCYLESNIGGAGGFEYGLKKAFADKYDFVWLMDDDGKPKNSNTLLNLMKFVFEFNYLGKDVILNSLVCYDDVQLSFGIIEDKTIKYNIFDINNKYVKGFINPFNGTLISYKAIEKLGFPKGEYFIKGDEKEYLLRALYYKVPVYTVVESLYFHPSPRISSSSKKFFGKKLVNNIEAGWKEYYSMRNNCLNSKIYDKFSFFKNCRRIIVRVFKIIYMGNNRFETIRMTIKGFSHALINKSGIYYLPGNKKVK